MSSCNHENVVSYHTSFVYKEELWLILRLLDAGSLLDIIRHKMKTQDCRNGVLDEVEHVLISIWLSNLNCSCPARANVGGSCLAKS
jgi:serine/threonine protein kinase